MLGDMACAAQIRRECGGYNGNLHGFLPLGSGNAIPHLHKEEWDVYSLQVKNRNCTVSDIVSSLLSTSCFGSVYKVVYTARQTIGEYNVIVRLEKREISKRYHRVVSSLIQQLTVVIEQPHRSNKTYV